MKRPELTPAALAMADAIAHRTAAQLAPILRDLVAGALADWAPACTCANPLPSADDGNDPRCTRCGRRKT